MYYYIDLVRILKNDDLKQGLDKVRRHIYNTKPKGYYCVAEISPKMLYHIHSIIIYDNKEVYEKACIYLRLHKLRNKVDDIRTNDDFDVDDYYEYINKQFIFKKQERLVNLNYVYKDFDDVQNFKLLDEIIYKNNIIEKDIFLP